MRAESEDDAISWVSCSPKRQKVKSSKSEKSWRVPNYQNDLTHSKRKRKYKRKCTGNRNKHENKSMCKLTTYDLKSTSPIIGTVENSSFIRDNSPVLYRKRSTSDSETEVTSPVLNKHKNKLIKLGRARLKHRCETVVRSLDEQLIPLKPSTKLNRCDNLLKVTSEIESKCVSVAKRAIENSFGGVSATNNTISATSVTNNEIQNKFSAFYDCNQTIGNIEIELIQSQETAQNDVAIEILKSQEMHENLIETLKSQEISENPSTEYSIEHVSSEQSSIITISSNGSIIKDSLEHSSENVELSSPKRKKKYKVGTLGHRISRILRKQKADVGIWKHELYLSSTSNYHIPATNDDYLILDLKIMKYNIDFGANILECLDGNLEKCLIIADLCYLTDFKLKEGLAIKIFPPYYIKYFKINQDVIKTYVNVYKIVKI